jgi:VWFA-related protein
MGCAMEKTDMNGYLVRVFSALLFLNTSIAHSQDAEHRKTEGPPLSTTRFQSKTDLMEVRAVVIDRKGKIVENLKKEDFELLENEQKKEINFFSIAQEAPEKKQITIPAEKSNSEGKEAVKSGGTALEDKAHELSRANNPLRYALLFADTMHLSFENLNRVKQALRSFIDEKLTDQDMVALATSSGTLGIAERFGRDRTLLHNAVEQIHMGPINSASLFSPRLAVDVLNANMHALRLAIEILDLHKRQRDNDACNMMVARAVSYAKQVLDDNSYNRTNTLNILKEYSEQMMNLPGKRMIVFFSDGFTLQDRFGGGSRTDEIQAAISRAVRSGVAIYTIDAKGLQPPSIIDASRRMPSTDSNRPEYEPNKDDDPRCHLPLPGELELYENMREQEELNGLSALATETGGKLFQNSNDLKDGLWKAYDANRFYYVLSYYLPQENDSHKFRNITVRVRNHPEYKVLAPKGYMPSGIIAHLEDDATKTPQQRLLKAMNSIRPKTDFDVSARADFLESEADEKQVSLNVYFEGNKFTYDIDDDFLNVVKMEIIYAIQDSAGRKVDAISTKVEGRLIEERMAQAEKYGYNYSHRLMLKPGLYQAYIGVREEGSDRMATAVAWVEVPEIDGNKTGMSSIILRNPAQKDPVIKESMTVNELEQIKMVQGIPLYSRNETCNYFFRVHRRISAVKPELLWTWELLKNGKSVKQEQWQIISTEQGKIDNKGWEEIGGAIPLSEFDPGIYELRVNIKEPQSKIPIKRTTVFSIE